MLHPRTCFEAAVTILVADGPVKKRLSLAYESHLAELNDTDLPRGIRDSFCRLSGLLHRVGPIGPQSSVKATIQKMSETEAAHCAQLILNIYVELIANAERIEPLKVVESAPEQTPKFLIQNS